MTKAECRRAAEAQGLPPSESAYCESLSSARRDAKRVPSGKRLHRLAERTPRKADFPSSRFYKALGRKATAKGIKLQEDQAGALRVAYRRDRPNRRRKAVIRAWAGKGY